jgi:hypothetical protein
MRVCYWTSQFFRKVDSSLEKTALWKEAWSGFVLWHFSEVGLALRYVL